VTFSLTLMGNDNARPPTKFTQPPVSVEASKHVHSEEDKLFSTKNDTPTYRRNTMATVSITSNDGKLDSASAVLEVSATNPE